MKSMNNILLKPIVSEKSSIYQQQNKYFFLVKKDSSKIEIRKAVEGLFGVKVKKVNTINVLGKVKRHGRHLGKCQDRKKAMVTVSSGKIDLTQITKVKVGVN